MTSTSSARRIPTLSVALEVTGSSPERVPGSSSPAPAVGAPRLGAVVSVMVTREPYSSKKTLAAVLSVQPAPL